MHRGLGRRTPAPLPALTDAPRVVPANASACELLGPTAEQPPTGRASYIDRPSGLVRVGSAGRTHTFSVDHADPPVGSLVAPDGQAQHRMDDRAAVLPRPKTHFQPRAHFRPRRALGNRSHQPGTVLDHRLFRQVRRRQSTRLPVRDHRQLGQSRRHLRKSRPECTPTEMADEVWEQLKQAVADTASTSTNLTDDMRLAHYIDPGVIWSNGAWQNEDPLVLPACGQYVSRPDVTTAIPNLILAGDYLKSDWEVANMETACGGRGDCCVCWAWSPARCAISSITIVARSSNRCCAPRCAARRGIN